MTKEKAETELKSKAREGCIYRVFTPLFIIASGQTIPGSRAKPVIADLSDVADEMIHWLLERDCIETADGTPINKPTGAVARPPCPCNKRS